MQQHAGAELSLQVENRAQILQLLADNEIDIAIMGVPPEFLDAVAVPFAEHPHGIVHQRARIRSLAREAASSLISPTMRFSCASRVLARARSWNVSSRDNRSRRAR